MAPVNKGLGLLESWDAENAASDWCKIITFGDTEASTES